MLRLLCVMIVHRWWESGEHLGCSLVVKTPWLRVHLDPEDRRCAMRRCRAMMMMTLLSMVVGDVM